MFPANWVFWQRTFPATSSSFLTLDGGEDSKTTINSSYFCDWCVSSCETTVLPLRCLRRVAFCESWQHERQWLSHMQWDRRGWGSEGHPWPPLEWTNTSSIEMRRWEKRKWRNKKSNASKCTPVCNAVSKYHLRLHCCFLPRSKVQSHLL